MTDHVVTSDPRLLDALRAQDEAGADSRALGRYAVDELHIEPPRRLPGGSAPSIVMSWAAGGDFDTPGTPTWALDLDEADPDDDYSTDASGWGPAYDSSAIDAVYMVQQDITYEPVHDTGDLRDLLDGDAETTNASGTHGFTYWLGHRDSPDDDRPMRSPELRVDLDPETGAGALRWLPDALVGVDEDYEAKVLIVSEDDEHELVWIPPTIARVSYETARAAAERYIETGARPDNVTWIEVD